MGTARSPERQGIPLCHPSICGMGGIYLSSNSWQAQSRLFGAAQNFPQCSTEPGLACEEKWKRRGKVIKSSSTNTIPARPGEAGFVRSCYHHDFAVSEP